MTFISLVIVFACAAFALLYASKTAKNILAASTGNEEMQRIAGAIQEGAHVFCHSRKDGKDGCVYLVINNSLTDTTKVELPKEALRSTLCGNGNVRNTSIYLNGKELTLGENDELPAMEGVAVSGTIELAPGTCTFFVM